MALSSLTELLVGGAGGAGNTSKTSFITLASDQTTGISAGNPILFATLVGDHTIASNAITVSGGQTAILRASLDVVFSASTGGIFYGWFIEGGAEVSTSVRGGSEPHGSTALTFNQQCAVARVTPGGDTAYELQITFAGSISRIESSLTWATVESYE